MYSGFRELLADAEGRNEWVAAINADIRGFSSVMSGDPAQTAIYLRTVYGEILDGFFGERSFFKPTGDGLLLVVPFAVTEDELARVTRSVVGDAVELYRTFGSMIEGSKLIKFAHPTKIGIGISVGSVSRLVSGDLTLDYTGRPLNVCTRLMDLARPEGVVFDSTLDFDALDADMRSALRADHVYLKGVADHDGVDIYYTSSETRIPERYRKPTQPAERFEERSQSFTRAEAGRRGANFWLPLTHEPADRSTIEAIVFYNPIRAGQLDRSLRSFFTPEFEYAFHRGKPHLKIDFRSVANRLANAKFPARAVARLELAYLVDQDVLAAAAAADDDIPF